MADKDKRDSRDGKTNKGDRQNRGGRPQSVRNVPNDRRGTDRPQRPPTLENYCFLHRLQPTLNDFVNTVVNSGSENPYEELAKLLSEKAAGYGKGADKKKAAPKKVKQSKNVTHDLKDAEQFPSLG